MTVLFQLDSQVFDIKDVIVSLWVFSLLVHGLRIPPTTEMKPRFEREVEEVLQRAGWFEGRRVSDDEIQSWNEMRPLFPAARRVLSEFAGLYVEARGMPQNPDFRESFCIDPVAAFKDYGHDETNDYEEAFGCKVRFIGFRSYSPSSLIHDTPWVSGQDHLLIDERGRLFWVDYIDVLIGDTIEHALNNLILGTGMQHWDVENDVPNTRTY